MAVENKKVVVMTSKSVLQIEWYLSYEVLYFEYEDRSLQEEYLVWENLILIKADSPEVAYKKAIRHGKDSEGELQINGHKGYCRFKGLKKLVPIYEEIEDGAEIEWREYQLPKKSLEKLITPKKNLQAFLPLTTE